MSNILNQQSPGGANGSLPPITFDNSLATYGDSAVLIDREIRTDFLRELQTVNQATPFSRGSGIGIDLYENEMMSEFTKIKLRLDIMNAVERYNQRSLPEKQIILSQEMIDFDDNGEGSLVINIFYIQSKDIGNNAGINSIQSVSIPMGV